MSKLTLCLAYLEKLPPAISGQGGHRATFRAACEIVRFGLVGAEAEEALAWWNRHKCYPSWTARELEHKLADARRVARPGERLAWPGQPAVPQQRALTQAEAEAMRAQRRAALALPQSSAPVP